MNNFKIIEYGLVSRDTASELGKVVNNLIRNGWQPYGAPYIKPVMLDNAIDSYAHCQAMVRYDNQSIAQPIEPAV